MKRISLLIVLIITCFVVKAQYMTGIKVEPVLKTDTTTIGQKIIYPQFRENEITILKITIPPGKSTGWHKHEIPVFAYVLDGDLTVEFENNKTLHFLKDAAIAEVINTYHNGTNNSKDNVVLIAFYMGEKGKVLSMQKNR
jgi:quercetin dioxygenase-like cupin family protein